MTQLAGKVAIVTGAGRGIGRAHALALARQGAAVLVNDLGGEFNGEGAARGPADDVAAAIVAAGGRAVADSSDISDWDGAGALVQAALKAFGHLDIVVNNAGITRLAGNIDRISRRDWERTIAVNLTGTAAVSHWAAAHWRKEGPRPGRRLINTSSGVGLTPLPGDAMYVASKAGVAALTIACAIELAELGVRVNGLAPVARSRISQTVAGELMKPVEQGFDRMSPENSAALVAYLASPLCRFTGMIFGIVGDDVTLWNGWSVARNFDNGDQPWTLQGLHAALAEVPLQQRGQGQALKGVAENLTPPQAALEALMAVEKM